MHLKSVAKVLCFILFCVILGEISVRFLYSQLANYNMEMWRYAAALKRPLATPRLPFHHHPNKVGEYYGAQISTNSLGFRDREYSMEKPDGVQRILVLGDSFTLGWGVAPDSVFSHRLESMLNREVGGYEVINMGIGNFNTVMEVELFKWKGIELDPDIVILVYFVNDTEPVPERKSALAYTLIKHSYFISFLHDRLTRLRSRLVEDRQWHGYYAGLYSEANAEHLAAARQAFRELAALCEDRGIRMLVASIPELRELNDYPFAYATDFIEDLASEEGVPFIDLLAGLNMHDPASLWVSPEDPHANAKANRLIAEQVYDCLMREVVLK